MSKVNMVKIYVLHLETKKVILELGLRRNLVQTNKYLDIAKIMEVLIHIKEILEKDLHLVSNQKASTQSHPLDLHLENRCYRSNQNKQIIKTTVKFSTPTYPTKMKGAHSHLISTTTLPIRLRTRLNTQPSIKNLSKCKNHLKNAYHRPNSLKSNKLSHNLTKWALI